MSEQPWTRSYPAGVRWDATIEPRSVQQLLDDAAARWPERSALEFMGRSIGYRELQALVNRAAKGLQLLGVGPGVHVGLYLPNSPHYPVAFFAVLKAGGTVVNYSPLDAEKVLEHKVEDSRTDVVITLDLAALYPQMGRLLGKTRLKTLVVGSLAEMSAAPAAVEGQMRAGGLLAQVPADARHVSFTTLIDNDGAFTAHDIGDPGEALAALQYTGGTTGLAKGAMLSHANLFAAATQAAETARGVLQDGEEKLLAVLPPFHIYAIAINMLFGIRIGATLVLHAKFDPAAAVKDIATRGITVFPGVPTMFVGVLAAGSAVAGADLRSLKFCNSGGAPLPLQVQQAFEQSTGCSLTEGWGMTETAAIGTFTPARGKRKPGSCGLPAPGVTLRFADVDDPTRYVAPGQRGEICIGGPNVMKGYWNNRQATAEAFTADGLLRTGDIGVMDEDGFVFIVDRTKDMILCSGFNVYPRNIEEAIYQHPAVEEVSVIGVHDAYRGQSPKAFVKLKSDAKAFTLAELQAFLADKLGKHEMVHALAIRAELPKTMVGKLSKKELYAEEERKHGQR